MDANPSLALGLSELLSRHALFESRLRGGRVLEMGAVGSTGAESSADLLRRGASSVVAFDPDTGLIARLRDETAQAPFSLIHLVDGAEFQEAPNASALLAVLKSALAPGGTLIIGWRDRAVPSLSEPAAPRATPLDPQRLAEPLTSHFPSVQFIAQRSVLAYRFSPVINGLGPDAPGDDAWEIDSRHARADAPSYLLAFCGDTPWSFETGTLLAMLPATPTGLVRTFGARAIGDEILKSLRSARYEPFEAAKATGCLAALLESVREKTKQ